MKVCGTTAYERRVTFYCIFCEHPVSTMDVDLAKGNRRTQAAVAMNTCQRLSCRSDCQNPPQFG
jgi:hypothetical protein